MYIAVHQYSTFNIWLSVFSEVKFWDFSARVRLVTTYNGWWALCSLSTSRLVVLNYKLPAVDNRDFHLSGLWIWNECREDFVLALLFPTFWH